MTLGYLRYYLLGRSFHLVTDHAPLKWMAGQRDNNSQITRWFLALQPFKLEVVHKPRKLHGNADELSHLDLVGPAGMNPPGSGLRGCV